MNNVNSPLVLVIDDDPTVRFLASEALSHRGFEVVEGENGEDVLRLVQALRPDVILLDVMMPVMNGFTACSRLRLLPGGEHIPVLMMTGLEDVESIQHAYQVGATDFITKPINFGLLEFRLHYMLRAKRVAEELRHSEARLNNAQRLARLGHFVLDEQGGFSIWSAQIQSILGLSEAPPITQVNDLLAHVHPEDHARVQAALQVENAASEAAPVEYRMVLENAEVRTILQHSSGVSTPTGRQLVGTMQDITQQRHAEHTIYRLAHYDQITGLANRNLIEQRLDDLTQTAAIDGRGISVLSIDLDHFQRVNDHLGQEAGNELLRAVGQRLVRCVRSGAPGQLIAPVEPVSCRGGDEFYVLLSGVANPAAINDFCERIHAALKPVFHLHAKEWLTTASIGVATFPADGRHAEELLRHADVALKQAKLSGRDRTEYFTAAMNVRAHAVLLLENNLRQALGTAQMSLHYQPKINAASGTVTGMEALARWHHPVQGFIGPIDFIPVAESSGLIIPLGTWILGEATRQTAAWTQAGLDDLTCAVNVSAVQLRQPDFCASVALALAASGLPAKQLQIELTESTLMEDAQQTREIIDGLKTLGVTLAIDDFGTGYSSLSYLKQLPIDVLKIDRSFVSELHESSNDRPIVAAVIAMGHSLGLTIVAEGVESQQQLAVLCQLGCDEIQGYLCSRPLPAAEFFRWMQGRPHTHAENID